MPDALKQASFLLPASPMASVFFPARVICMGCGHTSPRQPFQEVLAALNPGAAEAVLSMQRAGHDAEGAVNRSLRIGAGEHDDAQVRGLEAW